MYNYSETAIAETTHYQNWQQDHSEPEALTSRELFEAPEWNNESL